MLQKMIVEYLFNDKTKAKLLKEINDNVNIPIINEKTEAKHIRKMLDIIFQFLLRVLFK